MDDTRATIRTQMMEQGWCPIANVRTAVNVLPDGKMADQINVTKIWIHNHKPWPTVHLDNLLDRLKVNTDEFIKKCAMKNGVKRCRVRNCIYCAIGTPWHKATHSVGYQMYNDCAVAMEEHYARLKKDCGLSVDYNDHWLRRFHRDYATGSKRAMQKWANHFGKTGQSKHVDPRDLALSGAQSKSERGVKKSSITSSSADAGAMNSSITSSSADAGAKNLTVASAESERWSVTSNRSTLDSRNDSSAKEQPPYVLYFSLNYFLIVVCR